MSNTYGGDVIKERYKIPKSQSPAVFSVYNAVPEIYQGNTEDGASIAQFASDMVPYKGHVIVSKDQLQKVLGMNLHRPKLVLFTQKKHVPLLFKLLSNTFAGQVELCVHLNATRAEVPNLG